MSDLTTLQNLMASIAEAPVECDGFTRLAATLLYKNGIPYKAFAGTLEVDGQCVPLHYWIVVDDLIIDFRAQMWLGCGENVPHGVMQASDLAALYKGEEIEVAPLNDTLFSILMMPWPEGIE